MSASIDFVIGGKDKATPAVKSAEASLAKLERKTEDVQSATSRLINVTTGLAIAYGALKVAAAGMQVIDAINQAYDEQADKGGIVAQASEKASAAFERLKVAVGTVLAPFRVLIYAGIETLSNAITTLMVPATDMAKAALETIGPTVDWLKGVIVSAVNGIISAFTWVEVLVTNLDKVWEAMATQAELNMVTMAGVIQHALTVQIPAYAMWFADNFFAILRDGMMAAYAVVSNTIQNVIDAFSALWKFIASGGQSDILGELGEIAGRSYLEGFESTVGALPDVAARSITKREKDLQKRIGDIATDLGDQFSEKFAARMITLQDVTSKEVAASADAAEQTADTKAKEMAKKTGSGSVFASQGIGAAQGRLLTRGQGTDQTQEIIDLLKQSLRVHERTAEAASGTQGAARDTAAEIVALKSSGVTMVPVS